MNRNKAIFKSTQQYINGLIESEVETPNDLIFYTKVYFAANPKIMINWRMAAILSDEHEKTKNNNLSI